MKRLLFFLLLSWNIWAQEVERGGISIIAGNEATKDHAVIVAHNEDEKGKEYFVNVHKIPAETAKKIRAFLWVDIPGVEFSDSVMSESGVVITVNLCVSRETRSDITGSGMGGTLTHLLVEQAKTARQAVELAGVWIEKHGFTASGASYAIADTSEAWVLQVVKGKHWVAKRLPQDHIAVLANRFTIDTIDLNDKNNYRGSTDIIEYAIRRGWYNPKTDGSFHFANTYNPPEQNQNEHDSLREWRVASLTAKQKYKPTDRLPFSFKPRGKLELTDFFSLLRDHYEDSPFDLTADGKMDSPHQTGKPTICTSTTRYSFVAQMRNGEVQELSHILWIAFGAPDSNAYCPWYFSISALPDGYNRKNSENGETVPLNQPSMVFRYSSNHAFWSYARLSQKVERHYQVGIKLVHKEWQNFENYLLKMQRKKEKEFTYFFKKNKHIALKLITNYVAEMEYRKWFLANELIDQLKK